MYGDENGITNSVFKYPFSAILCTVEWQDQYNENKKSKIEDNTFITGQLTLRR
jgi:hypothetical protein